MPSDAYAGLQERLKDIDQLMAAHAAREGTQRGRRFDVEALNRGSVLLLSAHLEGYLEELMEEAMKAVNPKLEAERVNRGFANPTPDKIEDLFSVLGMRKPMDSIRWQKASKHAVKKNLRELVETRNRIAHGAQGVRVYKTDVTRYRRYVEGFAKKFDTLVRARVRTIAGRNPW